MLKLSTENNRHNLVSDFRMYYSGSYIAKEADDGKLHIMMVADVTGNADGTSINDLTFHGEVFDGQRTNVHMWNGSDVCVYIPPSGYYMYGKIPAFFSYSVDNRTNKKGVQPNRILVNGRQLRLNYENMYNLFNRIKPKNCFGRDLLLKDGHIFWRGQDAGLFTDGNLTLENNFTHLETYVCKVLGRFMAVNVLTK